MTVPPRGTVVSAPNVYAFSSGDVGASAITLYETVDGLFSEWDVRQADVALISVEGTDIRWTIGSTPPTSTTGHLVLADTDFEIWGYYNLMGLNLIAASGTATVQISLGRRGAHLEEPTP
jgi:hypothetical protein